MNKNMSEIIEEWRWVVGYEGRYQVSNIGEVKSMNYNRTGKERIMKQTLTKGGYYRIKLYKNKKNYLVHQLVAQAFLGHVIDGYTMVINHIDGNGLNNNLSNLEIVSQRENTSTCIRKDRDIMSSKYPNVSFNKKRNTWISSISFKDKLYYLGEFETDKESYKLSQIALSHINNGTFIEYYINIKNKLKNDNYKKILQYTKSGDFIREWNSATEAAKELNIRQSDICWCCRGKQKSAFKFVWKYKE